MSKPKVYCHQCANYHGYGWIHNPREHAIKKMHRCYLGGRLINFVTGVNVPAYEDCEDKNRNKWVDALCGNLT